MEAMRVGQTVIVLDPWYELRIRNQAVAEKFDRWCKTVDRATGMVHNDGLHAEALLSTLSDQLGGLEVSVNYLLTLRELGFARMLDSAESSSEKHNRRGPGGMV